MARTKKVKKTGGATKTRKTLKKREAASPKRAGEKSQGSSKTKKPVKTGSRSLKTAARSATRKPAKKTEQAVREKQRSPQPLKKVLPKSAGDAEKKKQGGKGPSLSKERRELLKKHLIQRRESIVKEAQSEIGKYIKGETNQLVETALDDGDWSVIDLSEDINFKRLESHRENLLRIDEALRKLQEGTYGLCEDCGDEVAPERLRVLPFAIYCRDCQEKREEFEKATRVEVI